MKAFKISLAALFVTLFTSLSFLEAASAQGAFAGGGGRKMEERYEELQRDFIRYLRHMVPELRMKLPRLIGQVKANRLLLETSRLRFKLRFTGDPEMNILGKVDVPSKTILLSAHVYRDLRLKSDKNAYRKDRQSARVFESVLKKEILHLYLATVGVDDEYYQVSGKAFTP